MKQLRPDHGAVGLPRAASRSRSSTCPARRSRCAGPGAPHHNYAFTDDGADLEDLAGLRGRRAASGRPKAVADIGEPGKVPLPVDISLSGRRQDAVRRHLHGRHDAGLRRLRPAQAEADPTRRRSARRSTWCRRAGTGNALYFTSSLLANWDKTGADNEQFLKAYAWDGKELTPRFEIDFSAEKLGRPHMMAFGAAALYTQ